MADQTDFGELPLEKHQAPIVIDEPKPPSFEWEVRSHIYGPWGLKTELQVLEDGDYAIVKIFDYPDPSGTGDPCYTIVARRLRREEK